MTYASNISRIRTEDAAFKHVDNSMNRHMSRRIRDAMDPIWEVHRQMNEIKRDIEIWFEENVK